MKSRIAASIFSLFVAVSSLTLGGCSNNESSYQNSVSDYSAVGLDNISKTKNPINSQNSEVSQDAPSESIIAGEPTFLIGLDGKAILTSEITRIENTDKTAETITKDDLWAEIYCDGFAYCKEPSGVEYDNYNNPELFDGYVFRGETYDNRNNWKRVDVGDEICGLTVKSAIAHFDVNDWDDYTFPERYFVNHVNGVEFEGTITIEGFLHVLPNNAFYTIDSQLVEFLPCENKLPVVPSANPDEKMGYITPLEQYALYGNADFQVYNEIGCIILDYYSNITCNMDGIGKGDVAYVRATLDNIIISGNSGSATLVNVECISDILGHEEDIE